MNVSEVIIAGHATGNTRDAMIIILVTERGLTLNAATKAYAEVAKAEGWVVGRESHKDAAMTRLGNLYTDENWTAEAVKSEVIEMAAEYGIAESTARDYCKAFSETLGVEHPVLDPRTAMFDWLVENAATATKADFKAFAGKDGLGRSDSNVNEYWKGLELHRAILAAQ